MIKSKKIYFILFISAALLTGCATAPVLKFELVKPTQQVKVYPESGQKWTGSLGETLLSKTILNFVEGIEILEEVVWEVSNVKYTIQPQQVKAISKYENGAIMYEAPKWSIEGINIGPFIAFRYSIEKSYYLWEGVWGKTTTLDSSLIKEIDIEYEEPIAFEQQLIYNGRVGDSLRFVYREFSNDMARSAFTQEAQYDLNESNIIGFKDVRIEVIEATNSSITYKVLNHFF